MYPIWPECSGIPLKEVGKCCWGDGCLEHPAEPFCCGLIPVRANFTDGLPQFLVENNKKGTSTKLKDKQHIIGIFIQVVQK